MPHLTPVDLAQAPSRGWDTANEASPFGIVAGPDGALWFTENGPDDVSEPEIGRITTSGHVTTFPLPVAPSGTLAGLSNITTGLDGALWFNGTDGIGRITIGGQVTEHLLPALQSRPAGLAVGSDGALWFYEAGTNQIGRITPG
jgi:virginiamycin B lyase